MGTPLDKPLLRSLTDSHQGIVWLQALARAGVRSGDDAHGVYALAQVAHELDDAIQDTYRGEQLYFPLPDGWWIWVPMLYGGGFLWAMERKHVEQRLGGFMWVCIAIAVAFAAVLMLKFVRERRVLLERSRLRPRLKGQRAAAMADLLRARDALVQDEG